MKKKLAFTSLVFLLLSAAFVQTADCGVSANPFAVRKESVQSFPITTVSGDQAFAQMVYNSRENEYFVVWQDYRESGTAGNYVPGLAYGQRVSITGKLLGAEIPISAEEPKLLRMLPVNAYSPDQNEYLVVYTKNWDAYGRFIKSDGTPRGEEFPISTAPASQTHVGVIYNQARQNYLVSWNDSRNTLNETDIYGIFVNPDGSFDGKEFLICDVPKSQYYPAMIYNSKDDEILVVWEDFRDCTTEVCIEDLSSLYGRRLASDGSFIGDEFLVIAGNHDNRQQNLEYNPHRNEYLVTWNDRRNEKDVPNIDIFAVRIKNDGTLIGESFPLCTAPNDQGYCTIAYDTINRVYLAVWNDFRDSDVSANIFDLYPFIGIYGGNVIYDPGTVYGIWLSDEGAKISSEFILFEESKGKQMLAMAKYFQTSADSGNFFVAWSDMRTEGNGRDVYGTLFQAPQQSLCPATALLGEGTTLNLLRRFRDTVLSRSDATKNYISLYYEHAQEVSAMLVKDKTIRSQTLEIIAEGMPVIRALAQGNKVLLNRGLIRKIDDLLEKMSENASDSLKPALAAIRSELREKNIFTQCGCIIK